ncbi:DDE-domain-containing protein [Didymella exigua CBS 183.55]|uniref:DDE-domain-containing protein n=1 Tax=Didymella exigua CBS 183.55 TaxID=1150837 RepID=A0A6A5RWV1_9PLEO|nr:DDE-domain-containing protein [Didymella exigua CBS 183.55]KAF1931810.1 DDE-domain-containing protein [Didymella exigua CBS 183.55]
MWFCKLNKIHLLYLPAHASYLLQPLDLAPFSVLKTRYRNEIRALSVLDDAAPIKKERFVVSYNKAREEALSERVIRAGWRAAGLCPFNPNLVLLSSKVTGRPVTPLAAIQALTTSEQVFSTPQSSQALYKAQQQLLLAAQLKAENQQLKYQLDHYKITRTRERVQVNPNEQFSNVESIQAAIDRAAALQAQQASTSAEKEAEKAAAAAVACTLNSMCTQWQR